MGSRGTKIGICHRESDCIHFGTLKFCDESVRRETIRISISVILLEKDYQSNAAAITYPGIEYNLSIWVSDRVDDPFNW